METRKFVVFCRFMIIIIVLVGCQAETPVPQPPTSQVSEADIQNVRVRRPANPEKRLGETEEFPLPNCGGSGELTQSLGTEASVSKGVTIGAKATTTGGIEVGIPPSPKLKLEVEVELAYQQDYETANSRLDTIKMTAAPRTHVVYVIQWEEQDFSSIVTYEMDGQVFEAPYKYVLHVPKIDDSYPIDCPTSTPQDEDTDGDRLTDDREEEIGEDHFNQGMAFFNKGAFEEAISQFNQALVLGWETAEVYLNRAWACQNLEFDYYDCSPERAISDYTRSIELNPQEAWAYIGRGIVYYTELEDDSQGLRDLNMAVNIHPNDPNPYFHRGVYFLRHDEWEALIRDMTQAIPLAPEWPDLHGHRGFGYQQLGYVDEARTDYEKFLEVTKGNPDFEPWRVEVQQWLDEHPY